MIMPTNLFIEKQTQKSWKAISLKEYFTLNIVNW